VSDQLDAEVTAHLSKMPGAHRALLEPLVASDATDAWLRDVLMAYLRHFVRVLDRGEARPAAESRLIDALSDLAGTERTSLDEADVDTAEAEIARRFHDRDYRFLGGRTPPHLGPYAWARTETRRMTVTLPRGRPEEVDVHFLHEFVIRGWLYWESFGARGAGGWYQDGDPAWPDGLYCVADRFPDPMANPAFQVSLLGHEAQHVADHRAFPGLTSAELEYRAKLVELIGYDTVDDRLASFIADASEEPEQPHPYAAHLIVSRLADQLFGRPATELDFQGIDYAEIRALALNLLDEDTASRQSSTG
jgi:hypothetical protein